VSVRSQLGISPPEQESIFLSHKCLSIFSEKPELKLCLHCRAVNDNLLLPLHSGLSYISYVYMVTEAAVMEMPL
jgi:hypothetical protein